MNKLQDFELSLTIEPGDIDILGHVNNVTYLRWVQEAATAHWVRLATAEEQSQVQWIVLRHEIDYRHAALPGDAIVARTWVGVATRLRFERFTEILLEADRKVLASAKSIWCPIDARTMKPTQISAALRGVCSAPE